MLEGAISGMTSALQDPIQYILQKDQMKQFVEKSQGSYVGIGVVVTMGEDGILTVVEPFEDSPALEVELLRMIRLLRLTTMMLQP